jgi:hypothetical protein
MNNSYDIKNTDQHDFEINGFPNYQFSQYTYVWLSLFNVRFEVFRALTT